MNRFLWWCRIVVTCFVLLTGHTALGQDEPATVETVAEETTIPVEFIVHILWIMITDMLVFIMLLGFTTLKSALTRSQNTVNILFLFNNSMIVCVGFLTYMVMGFNLMYPGFEDAATGHFKFADFAFMLNGTAQTSDPSFSSPAYNEGYTDFFFQAMFAATCARSFPVLCRVV